VQPFHGLDELWIQVAGTLCNLTCRHCFVTCGPAETRHAMMSRSEVAARVAEGLAMGVREIYLTGGEPFLNPELEGIVEDTLAHAPVTILTNGTLFTERRVHWLATTTRASRLALELRISLDGLDAPAHEAFRGAGEWARTTAGLRALQAAGLHPIVTVTQTTPDDPRTFAARAAAALRAEGLSAPRLKLLPMFKLGREAERNGGGDHAPSLASLPRDAFDPHRLQCGHGRAGHESGRVRVPAPRGRTARPHGRHARRCGARVPPRARGVRHLLGDRHDVRERMSARLALFGGVYGNDLALAALLDELHRRGLTDVGCLGDLGGFGPAPEAAIQRLRASGVPTVQGNYDHSIGHHLDDCACGYTDPEDEYSRR
jgi:uncharacterized Fe-S cluster-containing radical SAM superfamily protein